MSSPPNRSSKSSNPVPPRQPAKPTDKSSSDKSSSDKSLGAKTPMSDVETVANAAISSDSMPRPSEIREEKSVESSPATMQPAQPQEDPSDSVDHPSQGHSQAVNPSPQGEAANSQHTQLGDLDEQGLHLRQQPIPPPSESRQYRAIGLIRGRYNPSPEQFTRGMLVATDGTEIDAVLLGRVMSLVKKHINLEEEHLWVVYPRTREKEFQLHAQIVGVWEPEKLHRQSATDQPDEPGSTAVTLNPAFPPLEDGYFSIRGEVVFQAEESGHVTVKIRQTPKKHEEGEKSFKLQLKGTLTGKAVGYFWDLTVQRQETNLVIQAGTSIGIMPPRKKPARSKSGSYRKGASGGPQRKRPVPGGIGNRPQGTGAPPAPPVRKEPLPKPVIKRKDTSTNNPG